MKKVIVTGAGGFLGKSLVQNLIKKGIEVFAVVRNLDKVEKELCKNTLLHILELDLIHIEELPQRIGETNFDVFYHFAWAGTSGLAREDYELQLWNVQMACRAVDIAKKLECKKFIHAGSLMEYESIKYMQAPGKRPVGNYLYRSAKLAAHYMAKAEAGKLGLPFINLIISNVYGRGEKSGRFINTTLRKILLEEETKFTSGTQLYDFINIKDAAEAFYNVGEYGKDYEDYYIGSNQIKPLRQYVEEIFECLPTEQKPVFGEVPFDGVSLTYNEFDRKTLERDTGFQCRISFQDGILDTYRWLEEGK